MASGEENAAVGTVVETGRAGGMAGCPEDSGSGGEGAIALECFGFYGRQQIGFLLLNEDLRVEGCLEFGNVGHATAMGDGDGLDSALLCNKVSVGVVEGGRIY